MTPPMDSLTVVLELDISGFMVAMRKVQRALWPRWMPSDPNPFPRIHLFRRTKEPRR